MIIFKVCYRQSMSDQEEQNPSEQEDQEQNSQEDEDEDEDEGDQQDQDQQNQDGDQQDEDEDEEDQEQQGSQNQDQDQDQQNEEQNKQNQQQNEKLPKFRQLQTEEFKFTSLLSQISSLSMNVDHFINTLPSQGRTSYYRSSYVPPIQYKTPTMAQIPRQQPKVIIMKDEDIQVSMQPQIIIQPTKKEKPPVNEQYKISNQSNKFLAQLYQQNKKLKRWQNSSHNVNTYNQGSSTSGFYGSRERFERQQFQKGLFNVQQRNKQIDEAMELLKRSEQ